MTDAPVDLDELERGATQWERGEILASGVVSPTLLRMIARELRAARAPREAGVVTREHRMWAIACWEEWDFGVLTPDHTAWLDGLPTIGDYAIEPLIAQAIADAEARGAARAVSQEASELRAEVERLRLEVLSERDAGVTACDEQHLDIQNLKAEMERLRDYLHATALELEKFIKLKASYEASWRAECERPAIRAEQACPFWEMSPSERAGTQKCPPADEVAGLLEAVKLVHFALDESRSEYDFSPQAVHFEALAAIENHLKGKR